MLKVILLIFIIIKETAFASYTALSTEEENELVSLAHSKPVFNNVGILSFRIQWNSKLKTNGSVVYIGGRTCLTAAHCKNSDYFSYSVGFETKTQEFEYYKIEQFIEHPEYKNNENYDLAVLILDRPVEGLGSIKINNDFSRYKGFEDYQHLLIYVGYGIKFWANNWFISTDDKRRAYQAYTYYCSVKPKFFGIHATPYGQINAPPDKPKIKRPIGKYEIPCRAGMSGGGVFNEKEELVAIIAGTIDYPRPFNFRIDTYLIFARLANELIFFINLFCKCPTFVTDTDIMIDGSHTHSTTIAPLKDWIESVQRQYGEDTHIV